MATESSYDNVPRLVDHLFRHETGKLVAVLTRIFGPHHLELAEDVVQDTLLEAINVWNYKGIPEHPIPWLYKVAKNKALNIVNREKYKREYATAAAHLLKSEWTANAALETLFSESEIRDDQLRMMFTCCHPAISGDSQVALTLKTLCGFSLSEIARAFLTTEENINKRLVRARQKIREEKISFEVPQPEHLEDRLDAVLQTIYLLFNEGYNASTGPYLIRYELCAEAIRLTEIISVSSSIVDKSKVFACLALMYLNASRFSARQNAQGEIVTMAEQDRSQWDKLLMAKGFAYLDPAATNKNISVYHILAAISAYHCSAANFASTDWNSILLLYDKLSELDRSPLVALNRAIALSKVSGPETAIAELEKLKDLSPLKSYHLYYSTLGEFYMQAGRFTEAKNALTTAIALSQLPAEQELLRKRLEICNQNGA
ncbi:MAG: RNA polymerase sigma factor [Niastella sp.]|uniref:RNA polymerase sigma factor n=1 Tax=Niastella sp. TaxID=1869183 RepID=UPI00389A3890